MTSMDPRYQGLRGQKGPHPLLEIPCTDEELREGSAGHTMMPEGSQSLVDASLYMEASHLQEGAFHPPHMFNPESPFHQLLPNSPAPGNLLPAEYFDSLLNAYGVGMDPRQMADARWQTQARGGAFLQDGGLDMLAVETPGRGDMSAFQMQGHHFGLPSSNSPVDMYGALHRFAASLVTSQGGGLNMPVQTPRQLAGAEPSPYGASFAPPPEMDMSYGSGAQFTEPEGASQSRGGNPPEQGFNSRVLTSAACITAMIQKLRSTEDGVKREAMQAIRMWAGSSLLHQRAVAAAGAIPPLVDVLRSPSSTIVWVEAAQTLASLAINNEENKAAIGLAGAIPPLVNLLALPSREAREAAVGGLSCLARNEHNKQAIMDAGAVTGLVRMLTDGDNNSEFGREAAANVLAKLAVENDFNKKAIGEYGAIPFLIRMVEHGSAKEREVAAGALANLIQDPQNALELVGAGGVEALSELLDCQWEGARQAASAALTQVSVHEAKWNEEFNLLQAQGLEDGLQPVEDEDDLNMAEEMEAAEEILRNAINENGGEEEAPAEGGGEEDAEVAGGEDQPDDVSISESASSEEDLPLLRRRAAVTSAETAVTSLEAGSPAGPGEDLPLALRFRVPSEGALVARRRRKATGGRKRGVKRKVAAEGGSDESSEEDVPLGMRKKVMSEEDLPILAKGLKPSILDESVSQAGGLSKAGKRKKLAHDPEGSETERPQKRKRRRRAVAQNRASEERASSEPLDEEAALRALHSPIQASMTELLGMDDPPEGAFEEALARGGHVGGLAGAVPSPEKDGSVSDPSGWDVVRAPDEEMENSEQVQPPNEKKRKRGAKKRARPMQPPLKVSADVLRKPEPPPKLAVPEFSAEKADAEEAQCECIGATAGVHNGDCRFKSPVVKPAPSSTAQMLTSAETKPEPSKPRVPLAAGLSRLIVAFAAGLNASANPSPVVQPVKETGRKPRGRTIRARPQLPAPTPPPAVPGLKQGLPALMGMLRSSSLESQEFGCLTVALLAVQGGDAAKKNMVDGGIVPALISIVRSAEAGRVSQLLRGGAFFPLAGRGGPIPGQAAGAPGAGPGRQRKRRNAFTNVGADGYSRPPPPDSGAPAPSRLLGPDLLPPSTNYSPGGFVPSSNGFSGPDLLPPGTHIGQQQSLGPPSAAAAAARHIGLDLLPPGTSVTQFGPSGVRYRLPVAAMLNRKKTEPHSGGVGNTPGRAPPGSKLLKPKPEPTVREAGVGTGGVSPAAEIAKRRRLASSYPFAKPSGQGMNQVPNQTASQGVRIAGDPSSAQDEAAPLEDESGAVQQGQLAKQSSNPVPSQAQQMKPEPASNAPNQQPAGSSESPVPIQAESAKVQQPSTVGLVDLTREAPGIGNGNGENRNGTEREVGNAKEVTAAPANANAASQSEDPLTVENSTAPVASSSIAEISPNPPFDIANKRTSTVATGVPPTDAGNRIEETSSVTKTGVRNVQKPGEAQGAPVQRHPESSKPSTPSGKPRSAALETAFPPLCERLVKEEAAQRVSPASDVPKTVDEQKRISEQSINEQEREAPQKLDFGTVPTKTVVETVPVGDQTAEQEELPRDDSKAAAEHTTAVDSAARVSLPDKSTAPADSATGVGLSDKSPAAAVTVTDPTSDPVSQPIDPGTTAVVPATAKQLVNQGVAASNFLSESHGKPATTREVSSGLGTDGAQAPLPTALSTNSFSQAIVSAAVEEPGTSNPKPLAALARIAAANALSTLCVNNPAGKDAAVRAGGVQALAIMAALAKESALPPALPSPEPANPAPNLSENELSVPLKNQTPANPERAAALSALASLLLSDGPQKQRTSVLTAVPWLAKMMEGADALEVAAGAAGLQSIAASLCPDDSPAAPPTSLIAEDPDSFPAKHIPTELAFTLLDLVAGGVPEAKGAAIQALASFLVARQDVSQGLAAKLGGFAGLGGAHAYVSLHEQLRQAGRAGARALLSILGPKTDARAREAAAAAVAGAAARSRRLLAWLDEEGVAPALMGIFRTWGDETMRASTLAAAFNIGAMKGKLTGIGGEDIRALVEFLKASEKEELVSKREKLVSEAGALVPKEGELVPEAGEPDGGPVSETAKDARSVERKGEELKAEPTETGLEGGQVETKEEGGSSEAQKAVTDPGLEEGIVEGGKGEATLEATESGRGPKEKLVTGEAVLRTPGGVAGGHGSAGPSAEKDGCSTGVPPHTSGPLLVEGTEGDALKGERTSELPRVSSPLKQCKMEPEQNEGGAAEATESLNQQGGQPGKQSINEDDPSHVARASSDAVRTEGLASPGASEAQVPSVSDVRKTSESTPGEGTAVASEEEAVPDDVKQAGGDVGGATKQETVADSRTAASEEQPAKEANALVTQNAHITPPPNPSALVDHAAGVLVYAALGCDANGHAALVNAGGIPCIIKTLSGGQDLGGGAREAAAAALMMLAASSEQTSRAIRGGGGVTPLVEILAAPLAVDANGGKVWGEKEAAAAALVVLAGRCEEGRMCLIRAGGVRALVTALQCSEYHPPGTQPPAPSTNIPPSGLSPTGNAAIAQLLSTLAVHHPEARSEMTSLGVIRPLVDVLIGGRIIPGGKELEEGTIAQEAAAAALANIVQGDERSAQEVVEAGAIGPLVRALAPDARAGANLGGQLAAMTALASLVRTFPRCQKEMVRAGAVGRLMALVNPPGQMRQLKETAALVLTELATDDRELQETVGGSGAIAVLVGMLNGPGKGKLAAARALSILTSRCEANKHRARNAGADVSILSTLKLPGLSKGSQGDGGPPEAFTKANNTKTGPPLGSHRANQPGVRAPLTQMPGGAPRAINPPGKAPGARGHSGAGQNQAPRGPPNVRSGGAYYPPGTYPGQMPGSAGGPRPNVHHIRAPQQRTPQYYRPAYSTNPKVIVQRPNVFTQGGAQPRASVQRPVGFPGQSQPGSQHAGSVRAVAPGPKAANGAGRPPSVEMGTQAHTVPLAAARIPSGMAAQTATSSAEPKKIEVEVQASARIPSGAAAQNTESGSQSGGSRQGSAVGASVVQTGKVPSLPPAVLNRPTEGGEQNRTAEMGCQARPTEHDAKSLVLAPSQLTDSQSEPPTSKASERSLAINPLVNQAPKHLSSSETRNLVADPVTTQAQVPVTNQAVTQTQTQNPVTEKRPHEISRPQQTLAKRKADEGSADPHRRPKAFPDEGTFKRTTSADVGRGQRGGGVKMTSVARGNSELSLQMLAEVTATAEAEREKERNGRERNGESERSAQAEREEREQERNAKGREDAERNAREPNAEEEVEPEEKRASAVGGMKRARGELAAKGGQEWCSGGERIPEGSGTALLSGTAVLSGTQILSGEGMPRPPKKPRTGMHRTPSKTVAERFPGFADASRDQEAGRRGTASEETRYSGDGPKADGGRLSPGDEASSERGRRMKLRGSSRRGS